MGSVVLYKATHAVEVPPFWTPAVRTPPVGTVIGPLLPFTLTADTSAVAVGAGAVSVEDGEMRSDGLFWRDTSAATASEGIPNSAKGVAVEKTEPTTSGSRKRFRIPCRWSFNI